MMTYRIELEDKRMGVALGRIVWIEADNKNEAIDKARVQYPNFFVVTEA